MQEAISDSSTLIHLAGIGRLELLKERAKWHCFVRNWIDCVVKRVFG